MYASDTESYVGGDARLIAFAKGADLLIHDAQYTHAEYVNPAMSRQGWGHSTPEMAVLVAQAAGVKRLALFHHEPTHDDEIVEAMGRKAQEAFSGAFVAMEGATVDL